MVEVRTEGCRRDWRSYWERLRGVSVQLWGKKAQGDLVCVHKYLMGGSKEEGDSSQWCSMRPQKILSISSSQKKTNQNYESGKGLEKPAQRRLWSLILEDTKKINWALELILWRGDEKISGRSFQPLHCVIRNINTPIGHLSTYHQ